MKTGGISPVIHAAVIAYGFVYLHPFEDGNGRIHRFLIHNILSVQGLTPKGLIFPISAVMLKKPKEYDASLEAFSKPLLKLIDYQMDELGQMTVKSDSAHWYRFMDMTAQALALNKFLIQTVEEELAEELSFLKSYDSAKKSIQGIVDLPDRLIDLFVNVCLQNNGRISAKKRSTYFEFLTDDELEAMEQAVKNSFENQPPISKR
jgi:Fic family protein